MIRFYLFLTCLFLSITAAAQGLPGYVLTLRGDTLRGAIQEKTDGRILLYSRPGQAPQVFRAQQLRGYGVGHNALVRSFVIRLSTGADSSRFVLPVLNGPVELYSFTDNSGQLLRPAATDTLYELTAANWHLLFHRFLAGCPTIQQTDPMLMALRFTPSNVDRVVSQYNKCVDERWRRLPAAYSAGSMHGGAVRTSGYYRYLGTGEGTDPHFQGGGVQIGAEWTTVRSSGLQTGIQVNYGVERLQSTVYAATNTSNIVVDQRERAQFGALSILGTVGKRWAMSPKMFLIAGTGLGFDVVVRGQTVIQQRANGTSDAFRTTTATQVQGEPIPIVELHTGVVVPMAAHRELRLNVYGNALLPYVHLASRWGVQFAYYIYQR
jgi:hypothetical protein